MSATRSRLATVSALCLVLLGTACFHTTAPIGWLPTADDAQREVYGGWIKVEYTTDVKRMVQGELIAATSDSVHVLTAENIVANGGPERASGIRRSGKNVSRECESRR